MYPQDRLTSSDTLSKKPLDILLSMSDGNPGAAMALSEIVTTGKYEKIDPDALLGGLGIVFTLDEFGIYGSDIWILWKNVCDYSVLNIATIFRAHQLGIIHKSMIINAVEDERNTGRKKIGDNPIGFKSLLKTVKEQLPNFSSE